MKQLLKDWFYVMPNEAFFMNAQGQNLNNNWIDNGS